ncbi:MAG: hypothetical protein GC136_08620 [Alphaproteobacteria bacterium]|nr:hypothetical protein [Alphaproteobacteria bacterium]
MLALHMLSDFSKFLEKFGLRDKEIKVYLACLLHKQGLFAHEIAEETKLNRSTIDVIIQRLIDQQWLSRVKIGQRYKYVSQEPRTIHQRHHNMLETMEKFLPFVENLSLDTIQTDLRFYEGAKGIEELYGDLYSRMKLDTDLENGLAHIASETTITDIFPGYTDFVAKRIKLKIPVRILAPATPGEIWLTDHAVLRETKIFSKVKYNFDVNFDIYGDSVYICSLVRPVAGICIHNKQIAQAFRKIFLIIWDLLPATL